MRRKVFRFAVAFTLLALYVSTMVASGAVVLACHSEHHCGDVHTLFEHIHLESEHSCGDSCCHNAECRAEDSTTCHTQHIASERCCNHDHSNQIALYTSPRSADDNHSERQTILLALATATLKYELAQSECSGYDKYGEYLLPSPLEGYARYGVLRAPPALV